MEPRIHGHRPGPHRTSRTDDETVRGGIQGSLDEVGFRLWSGAGTVGW